MEQMLLEHYRSSPENFEVFVSLFKKSLGKNTHLARQYLDIISPIAEHFGMYTLKGELDTLCFSLAYPKESEELTKAMNAYKKRSVEDIARISAALKSCLKKFPCSVTGRFKEEYSVYRKLQRKKYKSVLELNDILAFRIIVSSNKQEDCFRILHILHDCFLPDPRHFKDYISIPKPNGYQSLHTVLRGTLPDLPLPVEVQIRTPFMDQVAKKGFAAHWLHKKKAGKPVLSSEQSMFLRDVGLLSRLSGGHKSVYCLVNGAHVVRLSSGSTFKTFAIELGLHPSKFIFTIQGRKQHPEAQVPNGAEIDFLPS